MSGLRLDERRVTLKHGRTRRSELAVRAARVLAAGDDRAVSRTPRRFVLQNRLQAVLLVLTPAELAFYHHEVNVMTGPRR